MGEAAEPAAPGLGARLWLLVAGSALCFLPIGAYATTLPLWLERDVGVGPAAVGALMAAMPLIAVFVRPLAGGFSDLRGRRLAAQLGGAASALGALLLFVPAEPGSVWFARAAIGIGEALVTTACMAWIVDMVPAGRRGRSLSWFGMSIWLGLSTGPQLGALAREQWGFDGVWALAAVCALLAVALFTSVPDSVVRAAPGHRVFAIPRAVWWPGVTMGLAVFGEGMLVAFGVQHLVAAGVDDGAGLGGAASVYSVLAAAALVSRPLIADLPDRIGGRSCALVGAALVSAGLAALAAASSFGAAAAGAAAMGVGMALTYPALTMLVAAAVRPAERGVAMGALTAFVDIGLAAGALGGGVLVAAFSTGAGFWVSAAAAAIGGAIVALRTARPA